MDLQAISGQLYIVDGVTQDNTAVPGLLAQPAPSKAARSRERDTLYAHLTLSGPLNETATLTQDLLDNISKQFFQTDGSITSALRRALNNTNQKLLSYNMQSANAKRQGAVTCAVLRDSELFVIQTGESLALVGHNFGVERLPAKVPEHITPLGQTAGLEFRYYHQRLLAGDMLLLADPRIAYMPSHALSPALVDTEITFGLEELVEVVGSDSARLLLVEFSDEPASTRPFAVPPATQSGRNALPQQQTVPLPIPQQSQSRQPITHPSHSLPADGNESLDGGVGYTTRHVASSSALGLSRFTGWLADLMTRLFPPKDDDEQGTSWVWPALLAVAIPLIVAIVVSSVYLQRGRVRRLAEIRQGMAQSLSAASEAGDNTDAARQAYNQLLTLAEEADSLRPNDSSVANMRAEALLALDRLDDVTRLVARPFHTYGSDVGLTAVTLRPGFNGGVYTLDRANDIIYLHETDESYVNTNSDPQQIFRQGDQASGQVVGELIDMMWRPSGLNVVRDGLSALDHLVENGALITYYPNYDDVGAAPLGLSSEWDTPLAITQFTERLYVLDPGAEVIWKYFPEGDGFNVNETERILVLDSEADLAQAVDLDIYSEDGSLILAYSNGRLRYYDTRSARVQWDETTLLQNGLITPLIRPSATKLVGKGLNASIFVLDAGNGRIIQISRGGTVLAQYRAVDESGRDVFTNGTDFSVAEAPLRIFVTVGNTVYIATQD